MDRVDTINWIKNHANEVFEEIKYELKQEFPDLNFELVYEIANMGKMISVGIKLNDEFYVFRLKNEKKEITKINKKKK